MEALEQVFVNQERVRIGEGLPTKTERPSVMFMPGRAQTSQDQAQREALLEMASGQKINLPSGRDDPMSDRVLRQNFRTFVASELQSGQNLRNKALANANARGVIKSSKRALIKSPTFDVTLKDTVKAVKKAKINRRIRNDEIVKAAKKVVTRY